METVRSSDESHFNYYKIAISRIGIKGLCNSIFSMYKLLLRDWHWNERDEIDEE